MTPCKNMCIALLAVTVMGVAAGVSAELSDSSTWPWKYEMNVLPGTQDLDGNGVLDMTPYVGSGGIMTSADGILTLNAPGPSGYAGYSDTNTSPDRIWQQVGGSIATGWEFEVKAKVIQDQGYFGTAYWSIESKPNGQTTDSALLWIKGNGATWGFPGTGKPVVDLGAFDNTDAFHTFRIVAAPGGGDGAYSVYRDGVLLNGSLASSSSPGVNCPEFQWGAVSSSSHGITQVDYMRFKPGQPIMVADAPIGV